MALLLPAIVIALALASLALELRAPEFGIALAEGAWWLVLAACQGYLALIEILVYVDWSVVPLAVRDGGLRLLGVRALPLAGSLVLALAIYALRLQRARHTHGGASRRMIRALRWSAVVGLGLLAPPGVWLELWLLAMI